MFVTNALRGVMPVQAIGDSPVAGAPGPVARLLAAALARRPADRGSPAPARAHSSLASLPGGREHGTAKPAIVLIDNYDSFTYNLAHMLLTGGCHVEIVRNDQVSADQVAAFAPAGIVISPDQAPRLTRASASMSCACAAPPLRCWGSAWAIRQSRQRSVPRSFVLRGLSTARHPR